MSGVFSFDPDKYVSPAPQPAREAVPLYQAPRAWARGLEMLKERSLPADASRERWAQIVADATKLGTCYLAMTLSAGWSIENLFGFDPDPQGHGHGLAVAMRGCRLIRIDASNAAIERPSGYEWWHPHMPDGVPLLWSFRDRGRGR